MTKEQTARRLLLNMQTQCEVASQAKRSVGWIRSNLANPEMAFSLLMSNADVDQAEPFKTGCSNADWC